MARVSSTPAGRDTGSHVVGSTFVAYDDVLAWCGAIEPEFVEEVVGWANEEILVNADMIPIVTFGKDQPVAWVPSAFTRQPLPEPKPIKRTTLRWRPAEWWRA